MWRYIWKRVTALAGKLCIQLKMRWPDSSDNIDDLHGRHAHTPAQTTRRTDLTENVKRSTRIGFI